jgi:putative metallopeptidase
MRSRTAGKRKKVSYELIDRESDIGRPMYAHLSDLIERHHEDLLVARIVLAWCTSWKPDVDGRMPLGKCIKATDLHRELAPYDFVILLNRTYYEDLHFTETQRRALIDHELCHAAPKCDARGEPVIDERGRPVFRTRKHDLEEFSEIADRYGCWKRDLEQFAQALDRARRKTVGYWIGPDRLHALLQRAGCTIPVEQIWTWSQQERLQAEEWAALRQELGLASAIAQQLAPPAHLAAALQGETPTEETGAAVLNAIHVLQFGELWEVWLDTGISEQDGICLGSGSTRDEAVAEAVQDLEGNYILDSRAHG